MMYQLISNAPAWSTPNFAAGNTYVCMLERDSLVLCLYQQNSALDTFFSCVLTSAGVVWVNALYLRYL